MNRPHRVRPPDPTMTENRTPPSRHPEAAVVRSGWWTIGRLTIVVLAIAIVWNVVGNVWLPWAAYIPANLAVAGLLLFLARHAGLSWDDLGLARPSLARGLLIGLGAALLIALVIGFGLVVPPVEEALEDETVRLASHFDRWFVPLLRIPLGTAVFEEIVFRSVLLGALLLSIGTWRAIALSSLVFGLWHILPAWETADSGVVGTVGAVAATVFITSIGGALFAVLRTWSGSVVAPILAHTATNSFTYAAALVAIEVID